MKKTLILFALCGIFAACSNSSNSNSAVTDSTSNDTDSTMGTRQTAKSTETNVDTNVNKIGTEPADTTKK